jgi:serine/threonine protein kinase/Tol biopolymer transport system component
MGQVWRATDTTLGRQVAIKILPDAFAAAPDRLARFEREAKTLASLNHPHIAAIHGFEKSSGVQALVMELVEGEDLSQRIARHSTGAHGVPSNVEGRGAIPLDEALPIAKQIAEALEAAHEQGIIHRDLKPANIKVRADGTVKVLDFGLAKATGTVEGDGFSRRQVEAEASALQTITSRAMTQAGVILGTAAYMSPEQARGKAVDKRADIWAFGAVLYEMLTGARAFPGENLTDTLAAVVRAEPDWTLVPKDLSPTVLVYLRRCLQKDVKQRVGDIHDVRLALEGAFDTAASQTPAASPSSGSRGRLAVAALAVAAIAIVALAIPAVQHLREMPPPVPPETRLDIVTPATDDLASFALSPDGRQIAFVASGDGAARLWVRSLATTTAEPLPGTEGATLPFWSPDSRSMGFFASGELKRIDLGGGAPQTLARVSRGIGGSWSRDGVIAFGADAASGLMRVSATGGTTTALTTLSPEHILHYAPDFLPDGRRFLFVAIGTAGAEAAGIYLGTLDGGPATRLTDGDGLGLFLPDGTWRAEAAGEGGPRSPDAFGEGGWLVWTRAGTLVAQRLDVERAVLTGAPVTLAVGVGYFSVAATAGQLAYRAGGIAGQQQLIWVDRTGKAGGTVGVPQSGIAGAMPRVSPDGRRVAVNRPTQANLDIWVLEGDRASRLTFDAGLDISPVWSPDGSQVVYLSQRGGSSALNRTLARGGRTEQQAVVSAPFKLASSWSADGRFLMYQSTDAETKSDLWVVPMAGDRTPRVFLKTPFIERFGAFSPDGRWVAYQSDETGRNEIYVRPFVATTGDASTNQPGGQWQVSSAGGIMPTWRPDGKEIYFLSPAGKMMATPIRLAGTTLEPGAPVELFNPRIFGGGVDAQQGRQYDIAPDGRFLINMVLEEAAAPITLIQNWRPERK